MLIFLHNVGLVYSSGYSVGIPLNKMNARPAPVNCCLLYRVIPIDHAGCHYGNPYWLRSAPESMSVNVYGTDIFPILPLFYTTFVAVGLYVMKNPTMIK